MAHPGLDHSEPLWYKDAIIYELHVRPFYDSNGAGLGDFPGLTQKLDYLLDLGVTALWLLPFYPSPLRDDGYDVADYQNVHPAYGTLDDFQRFMQVAQARGLRVITKLMANHMSDQHPWFQAARRAKPGSPAREFYVWSDTDRRYVGMGDNVSLDDRTGVRTPMQWSGDRNAGFSRADSQRLYAPAITDPVYGYQVVNVDSQARDRASLLWWMKRMLALRKQHKVFKRSTMTLLHPRNRAILAYIRHDTTDTMLIVANVSS